MKRPVSLLSLALVAGLVAGCSGATAGKTEFAQACTKRMGSATKCSCYADSVEKALSPEQFTQLATGVHEMRDMAGSEWIPARIRDEPLVNAALNDATNACFSVASR